MEINDLICLITSEQTNKKMSIVCSLTNEDNLFIIYNNFSRNTINSDQILTKTYSDNKLISTTLRWLSFVKQRNVGCMCLLDKWQFPPKTRIILYVMRKCIAIMLVGKAISWLICSLKYITLVRGSRSCALIKIIKCLF